MTRPKKILIANRGEIALRILRSVRALGMSPVVVYSEADRNLPFVRLSDQAYCIGPAPSSESYLQMETLLDIAKKAKVDAIHPGYGFFSENEAFARACQKAGIVFIGPKPQTIADMGDKVQARIWAKKANVPMTPGTDALKDAQHAQQEASNIGFPILLKAKAGGGGKGMRLVQEQSQIKEAFVTASNEAQKAFGDGTMYMEKCLVHPRHIEVQVFCDHHGNAYTFLDRECSLQRRHQKIVEEAPAPYLSEKTKAQMKKVSLELCKQVDYQGAGTIEYLVDQDENFYFLEMNTRLQVEHPVTEMVCGIDLVELQIRAAFGEEIKLDDDFKPFGHAIEVRIYAENPNQNFFPSPGTIKNIVWPQGAGIRIDSGIESGSEITLFYDPMIAKITSHHQTRKGAIARMLQALRETRIEGLTNNIDFLVQILSNKQYQEGNISTTFVEENMPFESLPNPTQNQINAAIVTAFLTFERKPIVAKSSTSAWWRSALPKE